jgi:hypothetical protein
MRPLEEIRTDIERATESRADLWEQLSDGADPAKSAEVQRLTHLIDELWAEERATRARVRFGPSENILARARAEDRLDRESRRLRRAA